MAVSSRKKRSQPVNTSPLNPFPFTKRLRPYLPDDQNDILVFLPPGEASIDATIATIATIARIFIPRAPASSPLSLPRRGRPTTSTPAPWRSARRR